VVRPGGEIFAWVDNPFLTHSEEPIRLGFIGTRDRCACLVFQQHLTRDAGRLQRSSPDYYGDARMTVDIGTRLPQGADINIRLLLHASRGLLVHAEAFSSKR